MRHLYQVTDPSGRQHTRASSRTYTHAVIRQNKADQADAPNYYYVSWASSEALATKEANVLRHLRSYCAVVPVEVAE